MNIEEETISFLRKLLHKVDDFGHGYIGCEGDPCECEQCLTVRRLLVRWHQDQKRRECRVQDCKVCGVPDGAKADGTIRCKKAGQHEQ